MFVRVPLKGAFSGFWRRPSEALRSLVGDGAPAAAARAPGPALHGGEAPSQSPLK